MVLEDNLGYRRRLRRALGKLVRVLRSIKLAAMKRWDPETTPLEATQRIGENSGSGNILTLTSECQQTTTQEFPLHHGSVDEYYPPSRDTDMTYTSRQMPSTSSRETTFIHQDAVRLLAERTFTETLIQEAELAESTLRQEEAMFQQCMDEIAQEMRKIMEDERWIFVSEYLSQKSEQNKLKENIRVNGLTGTWLHCPKKAPKSSDCPIKVGGTKETTAHVRFLLDESVRRRNSSLVHTSECLDQSQGVLRSVSKPERYCSEHTDLYRILPITPNSSSRPRRNVYLDQLNDLYSSQRGDYHEDYRCGSRGTVHEEPMLDVKCCCKKFDCCNCKINVCKCSQRVNSRSFLPECPSEVCWDCNEGGPSNDHKHGCSLGRGRHTCADHGNNRCPRHGCRTCWTSAERHERRHACRCGRADAKRTQSEKLPLDDAFGFTARGRGCESEATVCRLRPGSRRAHGHGRRSRMCHTCSSHRCATRECANTTQSNTGWGAFECGDGALLVASDKYDQMLHCFETLDRVTSREEHAASSVTKNKIRVDNELRCEDDTRTSLRRFTPEEERRLLVLIEARDALVQEAVEQGMTQHMAAISSLNQQIRAFVFSRFVATSRTSADTQTLETDTVESNAVLPPATVSIKGATNALT